MRIVQIPKGNGKFRTIYVPNREDRVALRAVNGDVLTAQRKQCNKTVVHGFVHGRSATSNAQAHVGHAFTYCFDLKDFFDTVTPKMVEGKLSKEVIATVFVDGAPRQGLPTSPAVANIAATSIDKAIAKWAEKHEKQIIYTRYADDLTISYDDPALRDVIPLMVKEIVNRCGFRLAEQKTRLYMASGGNRIVTGVAVGAADLAPTRDIKRRIRAARHALSLGKEGAANSLRGLEEWAKCKLPTQRATLGGKGSELERLVRHWKLSTRALTGVIEKPTERLTANVVVSGDPVYMLGMSTFTSGWTTCMRHPTGAYRKGCVTWLLSTSTRIALVESTKDMEIVGVVRKEMLARALVHELSDGQKVYGILYPSGSKDVPVLKAALEAAGYVSFAVAKAAAHAAGKKVRLAGTTPWIGKGPYIDGGTFSRKPEKETKGKVTLVRLYI